MTTKVKINNDTQVYGLLQHINDVLIVKALRKDGSFIESRHPKLVKVLDTNIEPLEYNTPTSGQVVTIQRMGMDFEESDLRTYRGRIHFKNPSNGHKYMIEFTQSYHHWSYKHKDSTKYLKDYGFLHFTHYCIDTGFGQLEEVGGMASQLNKTSKFMEYNSKNVIKVINEAFGADIIKELIIVEEK